MILQYRGMLLTSCYGVTINKKDVCEELYMVLRGCETYMRLMNASNLFRIGFIASSGGHWEELMCLKELADKHHSFFVTEEGGQLRDSNLENTYSCPQISRHEKMFILNFIKLFVFAKKVLKKEKPDFIITTGALIAYPFCLLAKIMKIKIVYIESFARVNSASLTGKLVYPFADLFLVQWESLLKVYPKAVYVGGIF